MSRKGSSCPRKVVYLWWGVGSFGLTLLKSKNWKPEQKNRVKQRIKDPHPENLPKKVEKRYYQLSICTFISNISTYMYIHHSDHTKSTLLLHVFISSTCIIKSGFLTINFVLLCLFIKTKSGNIQVPIGYPTLALKSSAFWEAL